MKRWLKYGLVGVPALVALAASALMVEAQLGERKMQRHVDPGELPPLIASAATAHIERSRSLFLSRGCAESHGAHGAGQVVIDDEPSGLRVRWPNITAGPGTAVAGCSDADWHHTLRHGVTPGGRPALIMPSEGFARLTDGDVGALVSHLRQTPPHSGALAGRTDGFVLRRPRLQAATANDHLEPAWNWPASSPESDLTGGLALLPAAAGGPTYLFG